MRISFSSHTIEIASLDMEDELRSKLTATSLLLGEDVEDKSKFYLLTFSLDCGRARSPQFRLGICSEDGSLVPTILPLPEDELVIIGFNKEIVGWSSINKVCSFRLILDSLFASFLNLPKQGCILGIHEIGVVAITKAGQELWRYDKDVVTEYFVENDKLRLKFMDTPPIWLRLSDGQIVS